jgi:hypothetical protein
MERALGGSHTTSGAAARRDVPCEFPGMIPRDGSSTICSEFVDRCIMIGLTELAGFRVNFVTN